ncbi:PAS domain S-box-containing protein/diguanylate cyclase (GGDEF) domain-containing protein [Poseidonocella pacifica]|uniref:PAS domain S-box-containing protein/diguanylate cyclase (GGDEF) domain-containing protein n=1 Tax=Poseidonocella pacifica TaxID=871651 RepID=A0A1I0YQE3_9RHOB|nr:EAL domain-containing protein [Poseidonocella pacifica]SFB15016.1 PAS domain S-box-containing protein/diguanylate cyclase (GGDEF) domain-containing protein [Poseidonocella pacifica]
MNCDRISETETDSRWITAVLSANQAVWDHDFERNQHYLSDTWRTLRGLTIDDDIPLSTEEWFTTIHANDVAHLHEEWRQIDAGETDIINYKFRQRHKDGHWVWFLSRGRVVRRDPAGLPARIVGTDTDITDIKTVELESQRMTQRLAVAMEAAGMGRWELNLDTGEAYWDDRMLQMLAVKDGKNNRPGQDWLQYVHPDDRDEVYPYLADRVEQKLDIERDYRILNTEGEAIHIRALAKFVDNAETGPRYYGVNIDITHDKLQTEELEKARALMEYESRHDALTKLANRRKLDEVFSEHVANSRSGVSVLHFDIDHFKQINDTLGHDAGDATLQHAADILRRHITGDALVSRVGGDEFVALMFKALDEQALQTTAEAIIREMCLPFEYRSQKCAVGISVGIATSKNCEAGDNSLFINADLALYEAKKAGRGRYRFYSPSMKEEARCRKHTFDALAAGIEKGEITCHYQPQFDAATLELSGLEALVRWEREAFGLFMPHQFLGVAEDMGILPDVDDVVLRRVLHDINKWERAGIHVPPISVNVSASRLNDPTFADQLRTFDIPVGMLSFELLESAFLDTKNNVVDRNLDVVNELGINIEIDDFGSGHASIASLLAVSPKRLKIDHALVSPIDTSERQRDLVKNIIGIGHMLGIKVVAEGVETAAHIEILQAMRCDFLQGFGLSRPMDGTNTGHFLSTTAEARAARKQA